MTCVPIISGKKPCSQYDIKIISYDLYIICMFTDINLIYMICELKFCKIKLTILHFNINTTYNINNSRSLCRSYNLIY